MANVLNKLKVVNDPAERAIKLCTDLTSILTKDEQNRQELQVVEEHRRRVSCISKKLDYFSV